MTRQAVAAADAHEHAHRHGVAHTHHQAPRGGPVVMDIGGEIGGLIVRLDESLSGSELPIEYAADPQRDIHTGVWPRSLGDERAVVAVYPELREGNYRIHGNAAHGGASIEIVGGEVTELDLRS